MHAVLTHTRTLPAVPQALKFFLPACLLCQLLFHALLPPPQAQAQVLPKPFPAPVIRTMSGGEPIALSKLMTLYLQAFDNQPGISMAFKDLDYGVVELWLALLLELDPASQYPLLMASHIYAEAPDAQKQRRMFEFTYREFLKEPNTRWRWLAHAVILARHTLHDDALALRYAQAISQHATGANVPSWAKQMRIFILEDRGEVESARLLLGGLLASHTLTDPHEVLFLTQRLEEMGGK